MNVGILTFHRSRNYGAVLQAYGLCYTVNKLGHNCRVIDYKCPKIEEDLRKSTQSGNPVTKAMKKCFARYKEMSFSRFNQQSLGISGRSIEDVEEETNKYDAVIVGSDQVWNSAITEDDRTFYLENFNGVKISYAASTGDDTSSIEEYLDRIRKFDAVSVREDLLQKVMDENAVKSTVVCDPTILAGRDVFETIASKKIQSKKYLFLFMIWESSKLRRNAEQYAKEHGLEVISNKKCLKFMLHSSPTDFISWVANSECVFTNSFHGTVFSLLFHKPFISSVVKPKGKSNSRVIQLLTNVACQENILDDENKLVKNIMTPNFEYADSVLRTMRNTGEAFLKDALLR